MRFIRLDEMGVAGRCSSAGGWPTIAREQAILRNDRARINGVHFSEIGDKGILDDGTEGRFCIEMCG